MCPGIKASVKNICVRLYLQQCDQLASSGLFHDRVSVSENVMNRGLGSRFMHIHMHTMAGGQDGGIKAGSV